jgi:hypothetical protein
MSVEQRMSALARANEIRSENAKLSRAIGKLGALDARVKVAEVLLDPDEYVLAIPVDRLIKCIHGFGGERTAAVLRVAGVVGQRRVRQLTERQRKVIARALRSPFCECGAPLSRYGCARCWNCHKADLASRRVAA